MSDFDVALPDDTPDWQAPLVFRRAWDELEGYAKETGRRWHGYAAEALEEIKTVDNAIDAAAAEDAIERFHEDLHERARNFVDRLLELRKFAAAHELQEAVGYIDLQLRRNPGVERTT